MSEQQPGTGPVKDGDAVSAGGTVEAIALLVEWAGDNEVEYEVVGPNHAVVTLPGEKKLKTTVSVKVGRHGVDMQAFIIRHPDENEVEFQTWLLRKNLDLSLTAFGVDALGDVYLRAALPVELWSAELIDRVLGEILSVADGSFNELLVIGFITSMKKEWAWRIARGESTRNLEAFKHILSDPERNEFIGTYTENPDNGVTSQ